VLKASITRVAKRQDLVAGGGAKNRKNVTLALDSRQKDQVRVPRGSPGEETDPTNSSGAPRIWHSCENRVESPASTTVRQAQLHHSPSS
jgi:hypothetical protein